MKKKSRKHQEPHGTPAISLNLMQDKYTVIEFATTKRNTSKDEIG